MKRRKPLRSDPETTWEWKKRSRRNNQLKRTPLNPVNKERRKRERKRAYGPEERRDFVTDLPCVACGKRGEDIHQAHIESGGMGRKADADTVVPLCAQHHWEFDEGLASVERFNAEHDVDLQAEAARVEREWQAHREADGER